ncbi:hypothetical protein [Lysobacter sp. A03]|uniref:hypothetical protein n=1 Tax=Lysobacter sp. A03 TaxID=1199154 RepID=UPI00126A04C3|nr:hypothetical protein [Lysobacter sp. A03]
MKLNSLYSSVAAAVLALSVAACGSDPAPPAQADASPATEVQAPVAADAHDAHEDHGPRPVLAEGQRWETDPPLRKAMSGIRDDVAKNLPAYHDSRLQAADAEALAASVEDNVNYMIANCQLEPEPDAVLHVMIGEMMGAATALREDPASTEGVPRLVSVVNDYEATFDHEELEPLTHD